MFSTPDLCDQHPDTVRVITPHLFRDFGAKAAFHGQAVTVSCFEDNSKIKSLFNQPGRGRVLVVDGGGSLRKALLGDQIAAAGAKNGWSGIIINGVIRDAEIIGDIELGVKALGTIPLKTQKRDLGDIDVPICLENTIINPGNWIYADINGIVVSEHALEINS